MILQRQSSSLGRANITYLLALKEIRVTESYLGLDKEKRGCQNLEPIDNCTTRQYQDTIIGECGCLPLNIRILTEVCYKIKQKYILDLHILGNSLHLPTAAGVCEQCQG